jgi:hypothetical protein
MEQPMKETAEGAGEKLHIRGFNVHVVRLTDYPAEADPARGRYRLHVTFAKASLSNATNQPIYTDGQIELDVNAVVTPGALASIARLLQPFQGWFEMQVEGSYGTPGTHAAVQAQRVLWTNIQPKALTPGDQLNELIPVSPS